MTREELGKEDFYGLSIAPTLLDRIESMGFKHPTPIQHKAIPIACRGEDVVGIAQTGTGKTLAFCVPMLQQMSARGKKGLILLPTRELAIQVLETLTKLGGPLGLRTALLIGGTNQSPQVRQLKAKPHIIVATPGRLIDMMEQKHAQLDQIGVLVLDEADRMLDMGFVEAVEAIAATLPATRQTLLFSATLSTTILQLSKHLMKEPREIRITPHQCSSEHIEQRLHYTDDLTHKRRLLDHVLTQKEVDMAIVFTATKHYADTLVEHLQKEGHDAAALHGDMRQRQRTHTINRLRRGEIRILVATDVAARGIDVPEITHVINFDLPRTTEDYVHRIGRTGRAGAKGVALSFATPCEAQLVRRIEQFTKQSMQRVSIPGFEPKCRDTQNTPSSPRSHKQGMPWRKKPTQPYAGKAPKRKHRPSTPRTAYASGR